MPTIWGFFIPDQIASLACAVSARYLRTQQATYSFNEKLRYGSQFLGMLDVTHRLVAVVLFVVVKELGRIARQVSVFIRFALYLPKCIRSIKYLLEELAIAVNCSWERFGKPV